MIEFILNNKLLKTAARPGMTVLDFVRYQQQLRGTKIGCREGDCGACNVLEGKLEKGKMHYQNITACLMPLANAHGKHIVTIEGMNMKQLNPAQQAMVDEGGTQCGFCTVGFIVSMTGYCMTHEQATYEEAIAAIDGNICRCTGYKSIERACQKLIQAVKKKSIDKPIEWLIKKQYLPEYFSNIPNRLKKIAVIEQKVKTNSMAVGGGTDLYVQRPEEMLEQSAKHLFNNKAYKKIYSKDGFIYIGAEATVTDIMEAPIMKKHFPQLPQYMKLVSSTPIRNMGTIAGNFVNASPIGDLTIFFLALNSEIILTKKENERTIALNNFYVDYKKMRKKAGEIIRWVRFKKPGKNHQFNFEKVSKRTHLDIASVNSAILISTKQNKVEQVHISIGGVAPIPTYLFKTSKFLQGKTLSLDLINEAKPILNTEISPISDARGTADYKRLLARQLFFVHFVELFPEQFH